MTSPDFTFGIEEEYFLIDPRTRNAVARAPKRFLHMCRKRLGDAVTPELMQSQIEIATPILHDMAQARAVLTRLRQELSQVAAALNLQLAAAGTHPFAAWTAQQHSEKPRYAGLIDDFQIIGRRNLFCGLHVHVAIPAGIDRVDVMNRAMRWLPLFLALSTSSPFWNRQRTGLMSYRQAAYDEWPRTGIPDFFADEVEYREFSDVLVRCGAIADKSFLWWAIRPALRYPTLELRIADACTRVEDSLAIAALFRCLVRCLVRQPELFASRDALTRRLIDENRWRAKRDGIEAAFIDERDRTQRTAVVWLDELLALTAEDARVLGCADSLTRVQSLIARGSSAHAQLEVYRQARELGAGRIEALRGVVDWLVARTVPRAA